MMVFIRQIYTQRIDIYLLPSGQMWRHPLTGQMCEQRGHRMAPTCSHELASRLMSISWPSWKHVYVWFATVTWTLERESPRVTRRHVDLGTGVAACHVSAPP